MYLQASLTVSSFSIRFRTVSNNTKVLDQRSAFTTYSVQTNTPLIDQDLLKVVSIHKPGTELVREMERDTIVLKLKNGQEYPFDYVENQLELKGY